MTLTDEDKVRIAELANVEYVATVEPPKGTPTDVDIAILGHDCEWCATVAAAWQAFEVLDVGGRTKRK